MARTGAIGKLVRAVVLRTKQRKGHAQRWFSSLSRQLACLPSGMGRFRIYPAAFWLLIPTDGAPL